MQRIRCMYRGISLYPHTINLQKEIKYCDSISHSKNNAQLSAFPTNETFLMHISEFVTIAHKSLLSVNLTVPNMFLVFSRAIEETFVTGKEKCSSFFLRNWFWLVVKYRTQEVFVSSSFLCNPFGLNYIAPMLLFIYCSPVFYPAITQKMSQRPLSITVWKQFGDVTTKILINQRLTLKVEK